MEQYSRRFIEELANHINPVIIDYFNKKRNLLNFSADTVTSLIDETLMDYLDGKSSREDLIPIIAKIKKSRLQKRARWYKAYINDIDTINIDDPKHPLSNIVIMAKTLPVDDYYKIFGDKKIFDDVSYGVQEGDKIGIVGLNGTGKTTMLNIIAGVEEVDEGQIIMQNGIRLAYLSQNPYFPENATVLSYALDGIDETDWTAQSEVKSALNQLGITNHEQRVSELSGGQKKKVALAKVLTGSFDILLLDEPTNHLDSGMLVWLEDYLKSYKGVVIMVTHDRYFLDKVTNKILEISRGNLYSYESNYSGFLELKAQREEMELASERKRQSVLRMELEWAKRGCRARSTKQRARLERLEALKNGKAPVQEQALELDSVETRMGKKTVELHHISKRYGEKNLVEDFDYICLLYTSPSPRD